MVEYSISFTWDGHVYTDFVWKKGKWNESFIQLYFYTYDRNDRRFDVGPKDFGTLNNSSPEKKLIMNKMLQVQFIWFYYWKTIWPWKLLGGIQPKDSFTLVLFDEWVTAFFNNERALTLNSIKLDSLEYRNKCSPSSYCRSR